jgi:hypothetical protein
VFEVHLRILGRDLDHVRAEVAERGRENERRAVEIDHRLHGLLDRVGLRDFFLFDNLQPRHFLQRRCGLRMRLIVAIVVARTDINEANRGVRRCGRARAEDRAKCQHCASLQQPTS